MRLYFKYHMLGLLLTLLLISLAIGFSRWQMDRAEEKTQILEIYQQRTTKPSVALPEQIKAPDQWRYRKIHATAIPISKHQFLLDNQTRQGRVGFNVLTPFKLKDDTVLLVDRGWVPLGEHRQVLPDVQIPEIETRIEGAIYIPYKAPFSLGGMDEGEHGWPRIIQFTDFDLLEQRLGASLRKFVVRLDPAAQHGYLREWNIVSFSPNRHLGYAFQGFAFAATVLVIFLVLSLKRKRK